MNQIKQNLAIAVREARNELGLSQERLAEILNLDQRTILNIEAGRGNPKFEKLYPLVTYLKIPAERILDGNSVCVPSASLDGLLSGRNRNPNRPG